MKKQPALLLVFILVVVFGCGKAPSDIPVNSDIKAAFSFQPGSYWIYQDSISLRTDSFYVVTNEFSPNTGDSTNRTEDAVRIWMFEKCTDTSITKDSIYWSWFIIDNYVMLAANEVPYVPNYTFSCLPFFTYPFKTGAMTANDGRPSNDQNNLLQIYPTYTLNGQAYSNVAAISHTQGTYGLDTYIDQFYLNDSIGIIKMRLYHPLDSIQTKVWELQRYNIVK